MRRSVKIATAVAAMSTLGLTPALGVIQQPPSAATGASPFGAGCNTSETGTLYPNSEVEPWLDVDPTSVNDNDGPDFIGVYQQDRYSDGGARGLGTTVSTNGAASFTPLPATQLPRFSQCAGNPLYERASDPWVSIAPDGTAHQISLSFNQTENLDNAVLVSKSTDGGQGWSDPITLKRDTNPAVFNDKESITADQNDADYVYAVWDRLVFPNERTKGKSYLNTAAFRGPTWFSRTTNGGTSWETARPIFDPGQNDQTIGNQIVALGNKDLVNVMTVLANDNRNGRRGGTVAVLRSTDRGASWSRQINVSRLGSVGVTDPDNPDQPVRTGDIIPEIASDERAGNNDVYVVWQDARFNGFQRDQVAFSRSTDGGETWSTPVRISTDNDTQAFTPAIRVDDKGNIGVTYYDFRNNDPATPELETDVWFTRSADGGQTWREERVTPESFDMREAPDARGYFVGDYEGLSAVGTTFYPFWSQSDSSDTDVFASKAEAPFTGDSYTPDPNEGNQPAKAFPVVKGKPIPR